MPLTFDPVIGAVRNLPGPGAALIQGEVILQ
jgi:hypothetical protein